MANADGLVIGAGALAFIGSFKEANGIPPNAVPIVGATAALAVIFAFADRSPLAPVAKGLAALMLLASVYRYIPGLFNTKGKTHG